MVIFSRGNVIKMVYLFIFDIQLKIYYSIIKIERDMHTIVSNFFILNIFSILQNVLLFSYIVFNRRYTVGESLNRTLCNAENKFYCFKAFKLNVSTKILFFSTLFV